ncbi:hypothetical protein CRM22_007470 [Opisthorchis felineus]|uniref:Uncharacterized protein n=2 Tax=Opisthorchis felineus TaxID=147828 RepID=A0A4S2LFR5_OPIFE|nr:hypothetical protein CRM22_007470 [Opisthorchis felineus]
MVLDCDTTFKSIKSKARQVSTAPGEYRRAVKLFIRMQDKQSVVMASVHSHLNQTREMIKMLQKMGPVPDLPIPTLIGVLRRSERDMILIVDHYSD